MSRKILSFRDPDGRIYINDESVFRIIMGKSVSFFKDFFTSTFVQELVAEQKLIHTSIPDSKQLESLLGHDEEFHHYFTDVTSDDHPIFVVEHEKVPFISYPYEWPVEMLYAAGILTMDLAIEGCKYNLGIKDASPYNVLFKGPFPIFIDVLSFEQREQGDYTWLAYAQFVRMFYLPLLVNKYFSISIADSLLNHRDGLEPEEVYQLCSFMRRLLPPFFTMISLPKWLSHFKTINNNALYQKKVMKDQDKADFIYHSLLIGLRRSFKKLLPVSDRKSIWSDYMQSNNNYSSGQTSAKIDFIKGFLNKRNPHRVLDVGCNTGYFSFLAAHHGASVVAIDSDAVVVGKVWKQAFTEKLDVLPLHVNLTRPTPQIGWRNRECLSFLQRTKDYFDCVFMLAIIHHLLVSECIPLEEIVDLAAELTAKYVVIEYVDPQDSMFRILTRGREALYHYLTPEVFLKACQRRFNIVDSMEIEGSKRCLYVLCKKGILND